MRKIGMVILLLVIMVGTFTGCGPDQAKIQKEFLAMLEEPATEETIEKASAYLDKYLSKLDLEYGSHMVVSFEDYVLSYDISGVDYSQWADRFEKEVYPSLTDLYRMKASEQSSPMAEDSILKISWEELAQRAYDMETFIGQYQEEHLIKEDATWMYGNYLNALVMGTNGTPIFDYKTHAFSEEAKAAYAAFINKNQGSTTAWVLTEYFTYLDSIGYTMNYNDKVSSKLFFDTCDWLVSEAGKRVYQ
ncbi:hypothetical protein [Sinanaerobacter chloroacetimidivorans]|uniref:Uncharacterized protein n=1 Tax=Sinanaerobacter chloroacetimidivorans TaxID=2818044 RepID=A0A8J8B0I7_9FIRM|nr:hypothetical protein [Sinanaerobacter chloroacetimidivorans]MBR0597219.1 hypothetical protein [Sinanaerobacter chloroacetimidivorans]